MLGLSNTLWSNSPTSDYIGVGQDATDFSSRAGKLKALTTGRVIVSMNKTLQSDLLYHSGIIPWDNPSESSSWCRCLACKGLVMTGSGLSGDQLPLCEVLHICLWMSMCSMTEWFLETSRRCLIGPVSQGAKCNMLWEFFVFKTWILLVTKSYFINSFSLA